MAKGHFRKGRYVVRYANGKGVWTSGVRKVEQLVNSARSTDNTVVSIETETGDVKPEDFLKAQAGERHCAFCGNLLEPDEGHASKFYEGALCDACHEQEPG